MLKNVEFLVTKGYLCWLTDKTCWLFIIESIILSLSFLGSGESLWLGFEAKHECCDFV